MGQNFGVSECGRYPSRVYRALGRNEAHSSLFASNVHAYACDCHSQRANPLIRSPKGPLAIQKEHVRFEKLLVSRSHISSLPFGAKHDTELIGASTRAGHLGEWTWGPRLCRSRSNHRPRVLPGWQSLCVETAAATRNSSFGRKKLVCCDGDEALQNVGMAAPVGARDRK